MWSGEFGMVSELELNRLCRKFELLSRAHPDLEPKRLIATFVAQHWSELREHRNPGLIIDTVIAEIAKRSAVQY